MSYHVDYFQRISYNSARKSTVTLLGVKFVSQPRAEVEALVPAPGIVRLTKVEYEALMKHKLVNETDLEHCFGCIKPSLDLGHHEMFQFEMSKLRDQGLIVPSYYQPVKKEAEVDPGFVSTADNSASLYVDVRSRTIYCRGRPTPKKLLGVMFRKKSMKELTVDALWFVQLTFQQYMLLGRYAVHDEGSLEDCFERIRTSVPRGHQSFLDTLNELRTQGIVSLIRQMKEVDMTSPADASITTTADEGVDDPPVPVPVGSMDFQSDEYLDNMDMF